MDLEYGRTFFETMTLKNAADHYLRSLPEDVTMLIGRGTSGCSIASAMLALSRKPLTSMMLRKEQEKSHRNQYAGYWPLENDIACVVDDLIDSGDTIARVLSWDQSRIKTNGHKNIKYVLTTTDHKDLLPYLLSEFPDVIFLTVDRENGSKVQGRVKVSPKIKL